MIKSQKEKSIEKNDNLKKLFPRLEPSQEKALHKLGIKDISDLLYHFPTRYGDTSRSTSISSIQSMEKNTQAVFFGKISKLKTSKGFKTKIPMAQGFLEDESGKIHCVWFNQPYLAKMISDDSLVRVEGKISQRKNGEKYLSNPKIEVVNKLPTGVGDSLFGEEGATHNLYPVYSESRGISSNWIYYAIVRAFKNGILDKIVDPIPEEILHKYNLPSLKTAMIWIHTPIRLEDAQAARKRFAFEEVFFIQIVKQKARKEWQKNPTFYINPESKNIDGFIKRFPFEPTSKQKSSISTIISDFKKGYAMSRLLEGDVGSGKTAVAAASAYAVVSTPPLENKYGRLQVAYMCPTEILASQHFESFIQYFSYLGIQIGLITGSGCKKFPSKTSQTWTAISKTQLLKWVESGDISIVIGTHALIQKSVKFKNLAYTIIDEQHRFGTAQRAKLVRKDADGKIRAPHLLSMTATPIPRTLALTIYGDLDLTLLDEMPVGRKPIITEIVMPHDRKNIYEKIKDKLKEGKQAYIICPRIDEPDPDKEATVNARSVIEEARRLKKDVFKEYEIGIMHSKMKPAEKDKAMLDFKDKKTQILCATSVVEVGVNVPNATSIIIEGGERFGLAQLHQLRGRVMRSSDQAYCYVFTESNSEKTRDRLNALKTAKNGFELAEYDLKLRGAGELSNGKQWGVSDIAMEALKNIKMVEAARSEAEEMVKNDQNLNNFPNVRKHLEERQELGKEIHLE